MAFASGTVTGEAATLGAGRPGRPAHGWHVEVLNAVLQRIPSRSPILVRAKYGVRGAESAKVRGWQVSPAGQER